MTDERDLNHANIVLDLAETNIFLARYYQETGRFRKAEIRLQKAEKEIAAASRLAGENDFQGPEKCE